MGTLHCSAFLAMSLDGFIAREDGRVDWLSPWEGLPEDHGYRAFWESIDAIVVGRTTYEMVLGFERWPYAGKRCVVLTRRPGPSRHGEEFLSGSPEEISDQLARTGARRAYVDGGAVVSAFLAAGRLDDLTVTLVPLVLGSGIRLFQGDLGERALRLESSQAFPSGLVQLRYRLDRGAPTG
ncbi:MAG TPA: dihydrofolate reductase family protein [Anaeromyxobacteraceae bacterium]|nr:dihydrofolate reductase family protein [Anaeromyxobacteraceae bacterium]